jgi:hypothetical protein
MPSDHRNYGGDMRVSDVVLADFVQFAPARSLSVVDDATTPSGIAITVTGPGYASNDAQDTSARPAAVLAVEAQVDIGSPGSSIWVGLATAESSAVPAAGLAGVVQWNLALTLPFARGTRAQRLVLREYECVPADAGDDVGVQTIARRLVYSDVLAI